MSMESAHEKKSFYEKFKNIIEVLKYAAREKRYTILDRLARSISEDMALQAVYEALRLALVKGEVKVPEDELAKEIIELQQALGRNITVARRLASIAIAYAPREEVASQVPSS